MWNDILFDLDGTLIDPAVGITGAARHALQTLGRPVPAQSVLEAFIGPPLTETFPGLCGLSQADTLLAIEHFKAHFAQHGIRQNTLYPGVGAMLTTLTKTGRRLHLATTKPVDLAVIIMEDLGIARYFTRFEGSEPGHTGRSKDVIIRRALAGGSIGPAEAVMVGDRRHDVEGAHANGLLCIGALYGYAPPGELQSAGAEALAEDIPSLQALLLGV